MTQNQTGSQTVLVVAMGLVTTATAVALYQHIGVPGPVVTTAALAAFLLLVTGHALAWRRERRVHDVAPARDRREQEIRRLKDDGRPAPGPSAAGARGSRPMGAPGHAAGAGPMPPRMPGRGEAAPPAGRPAERAGPPPLKAAPPSPAAIKSAVEEDDDADDFWSFRPAPPTSREQTTSREELPPFVTGRVPGAAGTPETPSTDLGYAQRPGVPAPQPKATTQPERPAVPREADVEVIQDAIKRLLEEVNAAEQIEASLSSGSGARAVPEANVDHAIEALRMTAGTMRTASGGPREASFAAPAHEQQPLPPPLPPFVRGAAPAPRPQSAADARARLMADAISAGRIDVTLEPILGLEDQQTRHYEVCVRLRDSDGNVLDVTPDGPDLRGTGLLPLFDGVRVTRTAAVARRLEERGKAGSVFSTFSGESVADEHFLGELAETLHQRASLATQLVLSFTQSDVRGFSTPEWDSLADMRALGFRFALSHITDLDMDFEALAEQGFAFVKLDASVFLEGLPAPSGRLPSSDVCRHLAKHGLTLVVEHIDDDDKLARVFGFGVLLGQGQLFGGPRPVRADVTRNRNATAAA